MRTWFDSNDCQSRWACRDCRTLPWLRKAMVELFDDIKTVDFECPYGVTEQSLPSRGIGDTVSKAIHAVTLGKVKPCGGCRKRQKKLNRKFPYKKKKQGGS